MMACGIHRLLCVLVSAHLALSDNVLNIDPTGQLGRIFEGIGGISGGGATSKLLVNYPPDLQSQILDYLFKPNFGASLHILKVEIGGDIQSTDGSEPSHMHYSWDENYQRGYEWWLMTEAKKRNPDIKLYALPWGFPGWIGEGSQNPYVNPNKTSDYIVRWINAAKVYYNLTIDYVGIWNERGYSKDYIKTLRKTLDKWGFNKCLIIASDNGWDIVHDMKSDKELDAAVHAVGCHYPGTWASQEAYDSGRLLWASEDYSTYNDAVGAGCWSRILNQNYVNGLMTSTIAWDLIASYYEGLPYFRDGLMSAYQPWSGKYTVELPIWATAHTTQFVNIGWKYLGHKNGVGHLPHGGSYVSLMSPDQNDLTIIFETISHDHSYCIRPGLPWYSVDPQDVTITLKGQFANITQMNVWFSRYDFSKQNHSMFNKLEPLKFVNGSAKLHLDPDVMFTLTTMTTGVKGAYPDSPPAKPFPVPYSDDFESYSLYQEPYDLAPQSGSFEVLSEGNNKFIRQMVTQYPVLWCNVDQIKRPNALIGNVSWTDYLVEVDYRIPAVNGTTGAMVAARIDTGGCDMGDGHGLFFIVRQDGSFIVSTDIKTHNVIYRGNVTVQPGWHKLSIFVQGHTVLGAFDQKGLFNTTYSSNPNHGFAGIGTDSYGLADFDNFYIGTKEEGIAKMREYFKIHKPRPLLFVKTFHMN